MFDWALLLPKTDFWGFKTNWANLKPIFFTLEGFLCDHRDLIFHIKVSRARLVGFFNVRLSTFATWNWLLRLQNQLGQPKTYFLTLEGFLCDHRDLIFHIRVSWARLKGYFNVRLSTFHILAHLPETDFWGFKINWANLKPNFFTFLGFLGDHSVLIFHIRVSRARLVGCFNVRLSTFAT